VDPTPSPPPARLDVPAWVDEISVAPGPPFLSMGVRASGGPGPWLTPASGPMAAARARVVAEHGDEVVVVDPGAPVAAAVTELAGIVATDQGLDAADVGPAGGDPGAVLGGLARIVADDLCVLVRADDRWILAAGCVCFPSHWRLAEKVGRPIAGVHDRVPRYADELAAKVDRFIDRLAPDRPAWRRNWLVHVDDRLFAPEPAAPPQPPVTADDAGARLWLRSERQTLRRLPGTAAVAFSILTQQVPLAVVAQRPDLAARMASAVSSWPADLVDYRGGPALWGPILGWLQRVAG
jgi:heme-dependent oxidative N-demethylase alpha subunit-like protein